MNLESLHFLTLDDVLMIHEMQLNAFGGASGIRDQGLLESAIQMPQASFGGNYVHTTVFEMAAAYAFHIAQNQPFVDGNKRAGLASALVFLDINAIELNDPDEKLYDAMIAIAEKRFNKSDLAKLIEELCSI